MPFGHLRRRILFGVTGGIGAVLRAANYLLSGEELEQVNFTEVRGRMGLRAAEVDVDGNRIKIAWFMVWPTPKQLLDQIGSGKAQYHLVEVMAWPWRLYRWSRTAGGTNSEIRKARARDLQCR